MRGITGLVTEQTRGQAFTLEALVASVVILGSLLFALQVSGVTSTTASTSSGQITQEHEGLTDGVIDAAVANDSLRQTVLYWDEANATFHGTADPNEGVYTTGPPTRFGTLLNETLGKQNLAYNVNLYYPSDNGTIDRETLVRNGIPSDDAVRTTRVVTLYDNDKLRLANATWSDRTLTNASFYAPDRYPADPVYAIVRVEVIVWPL